MRGLAASFLARRMLSSRLLLGSVLFTIVVTAALTAALATFGAEGLPQALHRQLARPAAMSITISGSVNAATAVTDTRAVRSSMRGAFGSTPYQLDQALWSNPLGLPAGGGKGMVALTEAAAASGIEGHSALTRGSWPGPPQPGQPVGAALPVTVGQRLGLSPGTVLTLRDRISGRPIRVRITGLFGLRNPASPYWGLDLIGTSGVSVQQQFVTYGPLVVSPAAFTGHGLSVGGASWVVQPDGARMNASDIGGLAARVTRAQSYLQGANRFGGLQVRTRLPGLLTGLAQNLVVAKSLLSMGLLQLLLLAAVALGLAARLLASHREGESALLASRGAARWQLVRPAIVEAIALGSVAAAAGALIGGYAAGLLMNTGGLRDAGLRASGIPPGAWLAALGVLALSTAIMLWPALRPPAPGEARTRAGRQAALAGIARAGGDLSLLALAVLAVVELRAYSAVAHGPAGGIGIDPVPVLAPVLALAGITLLPLRLLPLVARAIDGLIAKTRRLGAALASWEISRRPVRQSGPVLLVILAVGTGSLALSQYQSWRQSAKDQAAFAVGADVRVQLLAPLPLAASGNIAHAPGVTAAMPVESTTTGDGEVIGLDAQRAADAALLRPDLSPLPLPTLWRAISPPAAPPGLVLPGRPARLRIAASLAGGGAGLLSAAAATVTVQDAAGIAYAVAAGRLPADGRSHSLVAALSATRHADYPLRLLGVSMSFTLPAFARSGQASREATRPAALTVTGLADATGTAGPFGAPFARGSSLAAWHPGVTSPELASVQGGSGLPGAASNGTQPTLAGWQPAAAGGRVLSFDPGQGPAPDVLSANQLAETDTTGILTVSAPAPARVLPAIATQSYLRGNHVGTGTILSLPIGGVIVPVNIVAAVSDFPTVTGGGALIVDQTALQDVLASRAAAPLPVTQWWLRTAGGAVPPGLPGGSTAADQASQAAATLHNPISSVPQQAALAIAAAAALLAAVGFAVSVTASLRARQTQSALLAALGVGRGGQAGQLCLEQLMLSVPAAAAGLLAGAGLAHILVPAVTLTSAAAPPVPPVLVEFPLGWALALAAVVAAIPVVAAAVSVARRPDPAAELRTAQAS
jgi:predicted lysophospholipase L1 biosynthesis ABC-type transport system permease subunit